MKLRFLFILIVCFLTACSGFTGSDDTSAPPDTITVSAAISLKDAFNDLAEIYRSQTGKIVKFNFGASGTLQKQIETGAPADIFASAGTKQMDELAEKGLIDEKTRKDFAQNKLVLIVPKDSKLNLSDFSELIKAEKIAVGNPKTVPAGQYTEQVFEKLKLTQTLKSKLVFAENVRQVLDYVSRGEVDAGIVYSSDVNAALDEVKVAATAKDELHQPILYPIVVLKDAVHKQAAQEFVNLVFSPEGQEVLEFYGFTAVKN